MAHGPAARRDAAEDGTLSLRSNPPAFDAGEFDELSEMVGEDGVMEIVEIFETQTMRLLKRLAAGGQDTATQVREMHTLKGAAGTVASPRLAFLGQMFERAARRGIAPAAADIKAIETGLETFLMAVRDRNKRREIEARS